MLPRGCGCAGNNPEIPPNIHKKSVQICPMHAAGAEWLTFLKPTARWAGGCALARKYRGRYGVAEKPVYPRKTMPAENQLTGKSCAGDPDGGWDSYVFGCVGGETAAVPTRSACPKICEQG